MIAAVEPPASLTRSYRRAFARATRKFCDFSTAISLKESITDLANADEIIRFDNLVAPIVSGLARDKWVLSANAPAIS